MKLNITTIENLNEEVKYTINFNSLIDTFSNIKLSLDNLDVDNNILMKIDKEAAIKSIDMFFSEKINSIDKSYTKNTKVNYNRVGYALETLRSLSVIVISLYTQLGRSRIKYELSNELKTLKLLYLDITSDILELEIIS